MTSEVSRRESDDGYAAVVVRLNARWRVIQCRDAIQWIVQVAKSRATGRWRSVSYFRSRDGLIGFVHRLIVPLDPAALATLQALPAWIEEGSR